MGSVSLLVELCSQVHGRYPWVFLLLGRLRVRGLGGTLLFLWLRFDGLSGSLLVVLPDNEPLLLRGSL